MVLPRCSLAFRFIVNHLQCPFYRVGTPFVTLLLVANKLLSYYCCHSYLSYRKSGVVFSKREAFMHACLYWYVTLSNIPPFFAREAAGTKYSYLAHAQAETNALYDMCSLKSYALLN